MHVEAGSVFPLLIAQMPQRYAFAAPSLGERIVRVSSSCRHPVKIHGSHRAAHLAPAVSDLSREEFYLFSFYGGTEYNVWISFHGQMFGAFADYTDNGSRSCSGIAVDGVVGAVGPDGCNHVLIATHVVDTSAEQTDGTIPLYEMTVTCP